MVFGHKAADNILPWLRMNFFQKFLIQIVFLSHPQNIQWRYTLKHSRSYVVTFCANMNLFEVDIPPLEGVVQLRFLMTKKRTLEMMECVKEFVESEVLDAVHQRTDKVKIARTAKVEEMMKALNSEEAAKAAKCVEKEAAAVAAQAKAAKRVEAKAAKRVEKEAAAVAAVATQCKKMKEMMKSMAAVVAAVTQEMKEAVVGKCRKTKEMTKLVAEVKEMTKSVAEVVTVVAQLKEMEEAASSKAVFEAAAAAFEAVVAAVDIRNRAGQVVPSR
jgi:hypothetical protein